MNNHTYELMILADKYAMYAFNGDDTTIARRALKDALLAYTQPNVHHIPVDVAEVEALKAMVDKLNDQLNKFNEIFGVDDEQKNISNS